MIIKYSWRSYLEVSVLAEAVPVVISGDFELVEGEPDPLEVLLVLHPIDEVAADHVGQVRQRVVGREHQATALFFAQYPLVTLCSTNVLSITFLNEI